LARIFITGTSFGSSFQAAQVLWIFALVKPLPSIATAPPVQKEIEALQSLAREGDEVLHQLSLRLGQFRKLWRS
jgi:hypothetical protein